MEAERHEVVYHCTRGKLLGVRCFLRKIFGDARQGCDIHAENVLCVHTKKPPPHCKKPHLQIRAARKGAARHLKKGEVRKVLCTQSLSMRPCDELGAGLSGMIVLSRDDVCVVPPRAEQFASQTERNRCAHGVRNNAVCFGA